MATHAQERVADGAAGTAVGDSRRQAGRGALDTRVRPGWSEGLLGPVRYARSRGGYRPPPRLYARLSRRIGPAATSLGLTPDDMVTVEVPGRRSGLIRRATVIRVRCGGQHYVISLAGESDWARNVRAAAGQAVIGGRRRRAAKLTEVPAGERAPVIRAYLLRWGRRPGSRPVAREARAYFGVGPDVPLKEIDAVAGRYPVFRIEYAAEGDDRPGEGAMVRARWPLASRRHVAGRPEPEQMKATEAECAMPLPGDDLVPAAMVQTTRAVTVDAPPRQVWQWLAQIGQGRAGFYSDSRSWDRCVAWYYRFLSRRQAGGAVSYDVAADDRIVGAWQHTQAGDVIADGPPGTAYYVVRQAEPGRLLVLFTDTHLRYLLPAGLRENARLGAHGEISVSYVLTEPEPGATRLVRRMRLSCGPWPFRFYVIPIVLIWGEAITARNFLRGVRRRAEAGVRPSDQWAPSRS